MPPKKSSETGKSKAASTPKTRARTTGAKQTLNEEIRVQQGEKEQLIEDDPDIDLHYKLPRETPDAKLEDILTYLWNNPRCNEGSLINSPCRETHPGNFPASVLAEQPPRE
jgi:hypothetical protein